MKRLTLALLFIVAVILLAMPVLPDDPPSVEIGSQVITPTVSTTLTIPAGAVRIMFSVRNAGVHISLDGSAATTADLYLPPDVYKIGDDQVLSQLRFINSSDGAATISVKYFRNR